MTAEDASTAAAPAATASFTMKDFSFDVPATLAAGTTTYRVVNAGPQPHELNVVKLIHPSIHPSNVVKLIHPKTGLSHLHLGMARRRQPLWCGLGYACGEMCSAVRGVELTEVVAGYAPRSDAEVRDVELLRALVGRPDVWARAAPIHATGSALVLHPSSRRVLLRWHARMQGWLQVGGHADPGETAPFAIALREAREETGLTDLAAWPDPQRPSVIQIVLVPVPAGRGEPAHQHADIRFVLSTARPDDATPESPGALLRWLPLEDAMVEVAEDNLRTCLVRIAELMRDQ